MPPRPSRGRASSSRAASWAAALSLLLLASAPSVTAAPGHGSERASTPGPAASPRTGLSAARTLYRVAFTESGLPTGTNWTVSFRTLNRTGPHRTLVFSAPNGTYSFRVARLLGEVPSPESGNVTVAGGPSVVAVSFRPVPVYVATFDERGLPVGTNWSVSVGGVRAAGGTANLSVPADPGNYSYVVGPVAGFVASPSAGSVNLSASNVTVAIGFTPNLYTVAFVEAGLANGTAWSVRLNGTLATSTSSYVDFSEPTGLFSYDVVPELGYTSDLGSGDLEVDAENVTVPVTFTPVVYLLTFEETGLSGNVSWNVSVRGVVHASTARSLNFSLTDGIYNYSVGSPPGFFAASTGGTITILGANVTVLLRFAPTIDPVEFLETGLPTGDSWSVTVGNSTRTSDTSSVVFGLSDGTYGFAVDPPPGFTATPARGNVTVDNSAVTQDVAFQALPPPEYPVVFSEGGLPAGVPWAIWLNGTIRNATGSTLVFQEPNGTYPYAVGTPEGYRPTSLSGNVTVEGAPAEVNVTFFAALLGEYEVAFVEEGLPDGTNWSVSFGPYFLADTGPILEFPATNGTYAYRIGPVPGYRPVATFGNVTVNGRDLRENVAFSAVAPSLFAITFSEVGLPNGTNWAVTIDPTTANATGGTIEFLESNGSYTYAIDAVDGYAPSPSHGSVAVNGTTVPVDVRFSAPPRPPGFSFAGLSSDAGLAILLGVVAAGVLAVVWVRRRFRRSQGPEPSDAPVEAAPAGPGAPR